MAHKPVTVLVDDIDGGTADHTVQLALDGERYELDLSTTHRHELVRNLARYMAVARRTGGSGSPTPHYTQTSADPRAVREWARARGIQVPTGRRVPKDVIEQFHAAGN
ncbi:MAG: Lsr2 family protein [Beutenbergiaceae bacterium]